MCTSECSKLQDLLGTGLLTDYWRTLVVVLYGVHDFGDLVGQLDFREPRDGRQRLVRLNGEDAREDGARDAQTAAVAHEREELLGLEEQLRDDEVGAGVHLLLQVLHVLLVADRLRVRVRVARHADDKLLAELGADEAQQVDRVLKVAGSVGRRLVAAQRENVLDAEAARLLKSVANLFLRIAQTSDVQHCIESAITIEK